MNGRAPIVVKVHQGQSAAVDFVVLDGSAASTVPPTVSLRSTAGMYLCLYHVARFLSPDLSRARKAQYK